MKLSTAGRFGLSTCLVVALAGCGSGSSASGAGGVVEGGVVVVAGGTEVMPARNRGDRPGPLLDLSRVAGLSAVGEGAVLRLGAGVTCSRVIEDLGERLPVLAAAARTVASSLSPSTPLFHAISPAWPSRLSSPLA